VIFASKWGTVVVFHNSNMVFHNHSQAFHKTQKRMVKNVFLGQYSHTVDTKGRTFIPAKYRDELGDTFVVTRGTAKCLTVYPMAEWEAYTAKIAGLPQAQAAKLRRFVFSNASDVSPDSQGRIMLTAGLRSYAGIEKNVVIIGLGSYIEIWAEDAWNAENEETSADEINDIMLALNF
jgi:MraZ protein